MGSKCFFFLPDRQQARKQGRSKADFPKVKFNGLLKTLNSTESESHIRNDIKSSFYLYLLEYLQAHVSRSHVIIVCNIMQAANAMQMQFKLFKVPSNCTFNFSAFPLIACFVLKFIFIGVIWPRETFFAF